jgi:hypothetical protein
MNAAAYQKIRQLTVGELIVAITEAAVEATQDQNKAYEIAGLVLIRLIENPAPATAERLLRARDDTLIH